LPIELGSPKRWFVDAAFAVVANPAGIRDYAAQVVGPPEIAEGGGDQKAGGSTPRVFISYASQDAAIAAALVEALERHGIACWIAPRDVKAGALYADAIVRAISGAKAFVVVLSERSIVSSHVSKEIERASSKKCPIIALRFDSAPLTPALEYFLSESQWVEAHAGNIDAAYRKLIETIREPAPAAPETVVAVVPGKSADRAWAAHSQSRRNWVLLAGGVAAVVAIAALLADRLWLARRDAPVTQMAAATSVVTERSIAVLPFTDLSEKKDQEYFADGMAEEILDLLAKIPGLKVIGRTSSFQFKAKTDDLRKIGNELGAAYVLEGSVRRSGEHMRVTAQLIDTKDGGHRWSHTYDAKTDDVFEVQDAIAVGISRALELTMRAEVAQDRSVAGRDAYDLYLRGVHALDSASKDGCEQAIELFTQLLRLQPDSGRALISLAWAHDCMGWGDWGIPDTGLPSRWSVV
jgi:TolB-like protein